MFMQGGRRLGMAVSGRIGEASTHRFPRLLAAFFALVFLGMACSSGEGDAEKPVISLHDPQSESIWLNNAIAKFIIEEGYGYPVESVVESTPQMQEALPSGAIDVNI